MMQNPQGQKLCAFHFPRMLEQGLKGPSPAPDLIPAAKSETTAANANLIVSTKGFTPTACAFFNFKSWRNSNPESPSYREEQPFSKLEVDRTLLLSQDYLECDTNLGLRWKTSLYGSTG
jgi:hypothetical protein